MKCMNRRVGSGTVITYCTTGVLLRQLQEGSPHNITHIIVDEIHERSVLSDFLLLLLKRLLPAHPALKVVLMSATIDQSLFSAYFGGIPSLSVEGRLFPVQEKYLEDIVFDTRYKPSGVTQPLGEATSPGGPLAGADGVVRALPGLRPHPAPVTAPLQPDVEGRRSPRVPLRRRGD